MAKLISFDFLLKKICWLLNGCVLLTCSLAGAVGPMRLTGGVWAPEGGTPTYLEFDPTAAQVVISNKVLQLQPRVYLRGYTLNEVHWLDSERYLASVRSDETGNLPEENERRIVLVNTRDGSVQDTPHRGRLHCQDMAGNVHTQVYTQNDRKTRNYFGPLQGPVVEIAKQDVQTVTFDLHTCKTVPFKNAPEAQEKLKKIARPGWEFSWARPMPLRNGFGELMAYEADARRLNDPQLASNPQAQALARQPFTANMKVSSGIYALTYTPPFGKPIDIVLNPGEPISLPQQSETYYWWTGYFPMEDAYFLPMFSSGLVPFGLPSEVANLPHFARLLYRDGRVRLFSPPKVLWDDFIARRAGLSGYYSAAGIIWEQTSGPERHRVHYLQKNQELLRIEGMPQVGWYVMPDGCHLHMSAIDEKRSHYDATTGKSYPYTLAKYMIANLCQ